MFKNRLYMLTTECEPYFCNNPRYFFFFFFFFGHSFPIYEDVVFLQGLDPAGIVYSAPFTLEFERGIKSRSEHVPPPLKGSIPFKKDE